MSTGASDIDVSRTATLSPAPTSETPAPETQPAAPKKITNAQTVCNEKNERGKGCWGHLKQLRTAGQPAAVHLRGDDVLFKCQNCGTLYMGPPLGHVRDPEKQRRFVQDELTALLQAAGGTLPIVRKDERGVYVLVEPGGEHGPAAARQVPAVPKPVAGASAVPPVHPAAPAEPPATSVEVAQAQIAQSAQLPAPEPEAAKEPWVSAVTTSATPASAPEVARPAPELPASMAAAGSRTAGEPDRALMKRSTYAGVADTGPIPGETREQKIERLTKLVAAAKQRAEQEGG